MSSPKSQQAFADEVRAFLDEHLTPEVFAGIRERADHTDEGLVLALGAKGWLMPQWPKEDGGAELDDVCVKILETQLIERDAPARWANSCRGQRSISSLIRGCVMS